MSKPKKTALCYGVRSLTEDGKHIIQLDFDGVSPTTVLARVRRLQEERRLGDFFIIQNTGKKNSFHAICLTKLSRKEYVNLLLGVPEVDRNTLIPLVTAEEARMNNIKITREWDAKTTILRFHSPDKGKQTLVQTIKSPWAGEREISGAHLAFMRKVFNPKQTKYSNVDKSKRVWVDRYQTCKI